MALHSGPASVGVVQKAGTKVRGALRHPEGHQSDGGEVAAPEGHESPPHLPRLKGEAGWGVPWPLLCMTSRLPDPLYLCLEIKVLFNPACCSWVLFRNPDTKQLKHKTSRQED